MRMCEGNTSFFMQFCTDDTLTSCFLLSVIVHVKFIFGLYEGLVWFVKACHCSVRCKQSQSLELVTHLADQILCVTWRFHVSLPLFTSVPAFSDFCLGSPWCQYFYSSLFWEKNRTINPQRFPFKNVICETAKTYDLLWIRTFHASSLLPGQGCSGSWGAKWENSPQIGLQSITEHNAHIFTHSFINLV